MVHLKKKSGLKLKIAIIIKSLYAGSGPRGIDVYSRLLTEMLSRDLPSDSLIISKDQVGNVPVDLVHYTFFDPFFLTLWGKTPRSTPFIVTIHDMIPLRFPAHFSSGIRGKIKYFFQRLALKKAAAVITDSHASKQDIITYTHYPKERIHVIPLAPGHTQASASLSKSVQKEYKLPKRYILYVGDINWNKNVSSLIQSFGECSDQETHLVLVGKAFVSDHTSPSAVAIDQAIKNVSNQDRIHKLGFVPTHHLSALYKLATLYVQPSWYEGFGFPVIEALTQGTPVLSSNQGSLPEVGGEYVHYFDPNIKGDLTKKLNKLMSDESLLTKFEEKKALWVKQFSWKNVAHKTAAVYEKYTR